MSVGVLVRDNGDVIIVDAGFSRAELETPLREIGVHALYTWVQGTGGDAVVSQLAAMGIPADRVTAVIATHLHLDHIGGYADFPNAEVIAPAAEFASGKRRGALAGYIHIPAILQSGRARPVTLERVEHLGFPRFLDVFGDGSVVLLDASGHTAGSVAVLLTDPTSQESWLMIGDAAFSQAEYRLAKMCGFMKTIAWNREAIYATYGRIAQFERDQAGVHVIPAHDGHVFKAVCHG